MLESMLYVQGEIVPPPLNGDIAFKTSSASVTTVTTSALGTGFTTQYSVDGGPLTPAGASFSIPSGDHEVILKLDVTTGTSLSMAPFKGNLIEVTNWEGFQLSNIQFFSCTKLTKVPDYLPSVITDMIGMFSFCSSFNQDISQWDTGNVTNMGSMFQDCPSFNQDIRRWNVSNVTNISYMFQNCKSFNQDLSSMVFKSSVNRTNYDTGASAWNTAYRPKFTG